MLLQKKPCLCRIGNPCDYHAASCTTCPNGKCQGHVLTLSISQRCPDCRSGEMQFLDPEPKKGGKLVCSNLACDFEAFWDGVQEQETSEDLGPIVDALCELLNYQQNRARLFKKYYGSFIARLVLGLRAQNRTDWLVLHQAALQHYGPESDYAKMVGV